MYLWKNYSDDLEIIVNAAATEVNCNFDESFRGAAEQIFTR